ncbi:MAG: hypothetical protein CMP24_00785 [Rickettsiales bacterium]|nr:hypothetical protein [Rickettsiales bacterium]|tara:strand:- start:71 stop:727 length:657 start_codon:yes stop_codon:yes gene_type:complete
MKNKELIKKTKHSIYLISEDVVLNDSITSIEKINVNFKIQSLVLDKRRMSIDDIYIVDDSSSDFLDIIKFNEKNINGDIFLLSNNSNFDFSKYKKLKVFFKPFRLFSLYKELKQVIQHRESYFQKWYLEKSNIILKENAKKIVLTEKEYDLIRLLASDSSRIFDKDTLLKEVWKINYKLNKPETRVIESLISRLRKKLNSHLSSPKIIATNKGYKIKT